MNEDFQLALIQGNWCAVHMVGTGFHATVEALGPPTWLAGSSDPRTMEHTVQVAWCGHTLQVSGVHVGPQADELDWDHRNSNPHQHWNLRWSTVPAEPGSPAPELPEDVLQQLPSPGAWQMIGEWLLGTQWMLMINESSLDLPSGGISTDGLGWGTRLRWCEDFYQSLLEEAQR